jgi:predicted transposase YbfD/YdcC
VVAQQQVADKSNEIPAVRAMLDSMDLEGTTVTMDAMHAQAATAEIVAEKKGATS